MRRRDFWDSSLEKRYNEYKKDTTRPSLKVGLITKCFLHNSSLLLPLSFSFISNFTFAPLFLREPLNLTLYHDRRYLSHVKSHDGSNKKEESNQTELAMRAQRQLQKSFLNFTRALPTFVSCRKNVSRKFSHLNLDES